MTGRPRLIFGWLYDSLGGTQIYALKVATELRDRFALTVIMPTGASPALRRYWEEIGATVCLIDASIDIREQVRGVDIVRRRFRQWRAERALCRAIERLVPRAERSFTILHLDVAPWTSFWLLRWLSRSHNVVVTVHQRMPSPSAIRRLVWTIKLTALSRCRRFALMTVSQDAREGLAEYLPEARVRAVPIAYAPVDFREIDRAALRAGTDVGRPPPASPIEVVASAQFIDRKGPWLLLDAAKALIAEGRNLHITWRCPEPLSGHQQTRIARAGLGDRFSVTVGGRGDDSRLELLAAIARADLFVLPSLVEGLPLAIVEAMALGVPVVATRINGVPEAVRDGLDGLLVDPGDPVALAEAMARLIDDRALRIACGDNGRRRAREQFSSAATAAVMRAQYETLLGAVRA